MQFNRNTLSIGFTMVVSATLWICPYSVANTFDINRVSLAQSKLSISLIRGIQESTKDTCIVSPAGAAAALALIALGADAKFNKTAHAALGFQNDKIAEDELASVVQSAGNVKIAAGTGSFSIATAAAFDTQFDANPQTLAKMRATGAQIWTEHLGRPAMTRMINDWVSERTGGLIREIVGSTLRQSGAVVLNALYFKDDWASAFDSARTEDAPFQNANGTTATIPMMRNVITAPSRFDDRFAAIALPYKSSRFTLTLITTRNGTSDSSGFAGVEDWLGQHGFKPTQIELFLPRLTLRQTSQLTKSLRLPGIGEAAPETTFAAISKKAIRFDDMIQKVYLRIDEQGTEAGAATAVLGRSMADGRTTTIRFDRPFMFALRDHTTGLLLLSGYVGRLPANE